MFLVDGFKALNVGLLHESAEGYLLGVLYSQRDLRVGLDMVDGGCQGFPGDLGSESLWDSGDLDVDW